MPRTAQALIAMSCFVAASACGRGGDDPGTGAPDPAGSSSAPGAAGGETRPAPVHDLIAQVATCEVRHRGLSLDLGTAAAAARRVPAHRDARDIEDVEREGATFARMSSKRTTFEFWVDEPAEDVFVSLRLRPVAARSVSVLIDDKRLGGLKLVPKETRIVTLPSMTTELSAGRHLLELRFVSGSRAAGEPHAEVDWVRIGVPDEIATTYAAPTLRDIVTQVVLDGRPKRALALHAPSTIRCPLRVPPDAELRLSLGFWGAGSGAAEVRILRDGSAPAVLFERKVTGGTGASWTPIAIDLEKFAARVISLELRAVETTRGGRVAFAEPIITRRLEREARVPSARTVVIVVGASMDRRQIPPWGPVAGQSAVGELAREAAAYSFYRVPTSVPAAVVASLLTGLPPRSHALEDQAARLPDAPRTLNEMVKEASGRTAMFTGAPTTFAAFGFGGGWDRYEMFSPVSDAPSSEPLARAAQWLEQELGTDPAPRLVLIHTRGAHPPWDVSRDEVALLRPPDYAGAIDARRGGITLGGLRQRKNRAQRRILDDDWVRLRALEEAALVKQSAGIGQVIAALRRKNAYDDALLIFTGDVGPGDPPELPYDPAGPLSEDRLLVPLLVKFPAGGHAGKDVPVPVTSADIAFTVLEALRLKVPEQMSGTDLFTAASGFEPIGVRPMVATLGNRYAMRLGSWLLLGELGRHPALCELSVDPACIADAAPERPITARAAWQWTYEAEAAARERRVGDREPASIEPDTGAALTVWGDVQ
jgi:hypothetical protein